MSRNRPKLLYILLAALAVILAPASTSAQTCGSWVEVVARSFFPKQVDDQSLRDFSKLSPQEYMDFASQVEQKTLVDLAHSKVGEQRLADSPEAEARLRLALARFYDVGYQLYGVRLDPNNFVIVPGLDVNASASGSRILMNEGTLLFFTEPAGYVATLLGWQSGGYTRAQYDWLLQNFGWKNDWNSIYFVLAHEAAHNLMRHRDERILEHVRGMFQDYRQAVIDYRQDLAHGRSGGGVKRYLWRSLLNFADQLENAEKQRAAESEADVVAMVLFQRSGFSPAIALTSSQRMASLLGGAEGRGWQGAMTKVLCSSHPVWMARIQQIQVNLNCLQFTGSLCQQHIAYPVDSFLSELREAMTQLDSYHQETIGIAETDSASTERLGQVQVEVEPKDTPLYVDGEPAAPGKLRLRIGPHTLSAEKAGYETGSVSIVVFPDVQAKVKVKLKRSKR